ncbi:MAG: translational GTPase TypA [Anaerotruncus massiliensis (ex Togo et al. 2019)]
MNIKREDLRNIAIIAHVDHGKTTLVDGMLKQSGTFRRTRRSGPRDGLERHRAERGITILAKNASAEYKGVKINIVDTPGHADFGGEVERVLKMVDGVLLLVDAAEGPMPQTRFVLSKALDLDLAVIVVINKIDRPDARVYEVIDEVLELLMDLGASDAQLDSPMVCSGRDGTASISPEVAGTDLLPLMDTIVDYIQPPQGDPELPTAVLVSSIDYNDYVGRMAVGRIEQGTLRVNEQMNVCDYHDKELLKQGKITAIYQFTGVGRTQVESATVGDIVQFSGIEDINIGNTVCAAGSSIALPFVKISEPTVEMTFSVNTSPFAGREGKFVTTRQIRDRLYRELLRDVSLRVSDGDTADSFVVCGRGEMHLSILIENMRREGYEFQVSTPKVLLKTIDGELCEPFEELTIDVPAESSGSVMEKMGPRKGELQSMEPVGSRMKMTFVIPERGLFGYKSEFLTDTKGEGVMNTLFHGYAPYKGDIPRRQNGSLIAFETGETITYGLYNAQERGTLFLGAGEPVYAGQVVGMSPKNEDIAVNVCKKKQLTNTRASGSDDALRLIPPRRFSHEESLEFLSDDELLEVTPKSIRIRKKVLDHAQRMREQMKKKS